MSRSKRAPLRRCLACRSRLPKPDLLRIVRTPAGGAAFDPTGRAQGRGAYICPRPDCLEKALRRRSISRSLGVPGEAEVAQRLREAAADLDDGKVS